MGRMELGNDGQALINMLRASRSSEPVVVVELEEVARKHWIFGYCRSRNGRFPEKPIFQVQAGGDGDAEVSRQEGIMPGGTRDSKVGILRCEIVFNRRERQIRSLCTIVSIHPTWGWLNRKIHRSYSADRRGPGQWARTHLCELDRSHHQSP